jgi:outer membrane protein TolC
MKGTAQADGIEPSVVAHTPAQSLSLREALDLALRNNRLVNIAGLQVEQAKHRVAGARTNILPQIDISGTGGELLDKVNVYIPAGIFGSVNGTSVPSHEVDISTKNHFSTIYSISVAQPLSQIPRIKTEIDLQKVGADVAREQERSQRQSIAANVRNLYYALLQTQDGVKATNELLRALQELERSVADNVVQQSALLADLLEVQARVVAQEATLSAQLDTMQQDKEQINILLGRDVKTPFQVVPEPDDSLLESSQYEDIDRLQSQALNDRPDLKRSAMQIRQAELARRNALLDYIPDLSIGVRYSGLGTGINALPDHIVTAGLILSWKDPWDWGRRRHEIAAQTLAIHEAKLANEEAKSAAQVDVNNQIRREQEAHDRIHAAQAAQVAANERLRVTLNQYRAKEALSKDVLQAEAALADIDRQVQDARLAYRTAQSELRRALGEE